MQYLEYCNLTYRSFVNALKGYRNKSERDSNERLIIMRKIMFASLLPHLKKGAKETDILSFDFEKKVITKMTEEEILEMEKEIELVKSFWAKQDAKA